MAKALRKIELMHRQFGVIEGKTCGECSNLTEHRYDKLYRKCKVYGETSSEASDWAMRWKACGMFGREETRQMVSDGEKSRFFRGIGPEAQPEEPLEGQIEMEAMKDD